MDIWTYKPDVLEIKSSLKLLGSLFQGSDSRARENEFTMKKKNGGGIEKGEVPSLSHSLLVPSPPPRFPGVEFNSPLPSDRRALLSERLEQASCSVIAFMSFLSLRKQPTFRVATSGFPTK